MKRYSPHHRLIPLLALMVPAVTQAADAEEQENSETQAERDRREIVVTANPAIVAALRDFQPEQTYDAESVASYAVNTVGEVIDEIAADNADDEPALLVNGEPVNNMGDISDFPAEAIARIEVLPRGSARRIGGAAGQRVYNIILRRRLTSVTTTAAHRRATEGGWGEERGEVAVTGIRNRDRLNLSLRARDSNLLLESDRGIMQPVPDWPYDPVGNIIPAPDFGAEIDPALTALAGVPVSVAAVPAGITSPTLANFAGGANLPNTADFGQYRSLRSSSRNYRASLAGNKQITSWLSAALNGNLEWSDNRGLSGLPSAVFLITGDNIATPFSRDVLLVRSDMENPLQNRNRTEKASVSLTSNANFGSWLASAGANFNSTALDFSFDFLNPVALQAPIPLNPQRNPFDSTGLTFPVLTVTSSTQITRYEGQVSINGPLFDLPAGGVRVRLGMNAVRNKITLGDGTDFNRTDVSQDGGVTIPLTSREGNVLAALGTIDLSLDAGRTELSNQRSLDRYSASLAWRFRRGIRFSGEITRGENPVEPSVLTAPLTIDENVRIYDPIRDEVVDVSFVSGGNPGLVAETEGVTRLSTTLTPLPRYNLRLRGEFSRTRTRDLIGSVPATSPEVMAAFPDRFIRDSAGRLISVDERPVNFTRQRQERLRFGVAFRVPFYQGPVGAAPVATESEDEEERDTAPVSQAVTAARPRPRLDVSLNHTVILSNSLLIRPGLPVIDLLEQGAAGIGGVTPQHTITGSIAFSDRGTGVRINGVWRSATALIRDTGSASDRIQFGSLGTFNLRAFTDTARFFPGKWWAKGTRASLTVNNVFNTRQRVVNAAGETPLSYQPAYRDPIGRTIMVELRKTF